MIKIWWASCSIVWWLLFAFHAVSNLEELVIKDKTTSEKIKTRGLESYSSILEADKAILAAHGYDTITIVDCDSFLFGWVGTYF